MAAAAAPAELPGDSDAARETAGAAPPPVGPGPFHGPFHGACGAGRTGSDAAGRSASLQLANALSSPVLKARRGPGEEGGGGSAPTPCPYHSSPSLQAVVGVSADTAGALEGLIRGSWAPNATYALCRLGVPDALSTAPGSARSAAELAQELHCDAACLLRLLRLCAAYGLLQETEVAAAAAATAGSGATAAAAAATAGSGATAVAAGEAGEAPAAAAETGEAPPSPWQQARDRERAAAGAEPRGSPAAQPDRSGSSGAGSGSADLGARSGSGSASDAASCGVTSSAGSGLVSSGSGLALLSSGSLGTAVSGGEGGGSEVGVGVGGGDGAAGAKAQSPPPREALSRFHLTEMGAMLKSTHPSCMHWLALMLGLPGHYLSRGFLYDNVKEGRMGFEKAFGCDWYSYVAREPLEARAFDRAMTATATADAQLVAGAYDFGRHDVVMDAGGGHGLLLGAILHRHPGVRSGVVMELPGVVAAARRLGRKGLERLSYVEGDFFSPFPRAADCIVMRLVLHDWPDDKATQILRHAAAALAQSGQGGGGLHPGEEGKGEVGAEEQQEGQRGHGPEAAGPGGPGGPGAGPVGPRAGPVLVVVDAVLPELVGPGASPATVAQLEFDMGMMLMTTGRERSLSEWRALLRGGGFELQQVLHPGGGSKELSVLVAAPVGI
ncbi:hypothetical protein HYH03_003319 [Edaphochlamys debaryana]|uniref:O-methyltransferase domain-containing protein n=1 Tax=Edaphochlamys debaryana TaxID=47281 RepID=A0A836C463_9CHLO|nr:hypothetical protein HYH03_003319 [Edaphochlamys debaryana]|eukprot:KAG2498568.1 hypothetical protein HYH03_003319 [Edaphochlamys debaryana]